VTNLFSDQVDRYGGVENTLKEIRTGVERSPKSVLVLNAEDPLSASLAIDVPNKVVWYGLNDTVGTQGNVDLSDAGKCPKCGSDYEYDYHIYAHLGGFRCPQCGHRRQDADVAVSAITEKSSEGSVVRMRPGKKASEQDVRIALPAVYNIYNAAASVAAILALKLPAQEAVDALSSARASFGRLETFDLNGNRLQMILVKNPAGCNQAFSYITGLEEDFSAVLCLNNRTGDGHDISWIESTDYEKLVNSPHLKKLYVGGDKAQDLYARLQKAGAADEALELFTDYSALVEKLKEEPNPVFLLPNYTAMMELRDALSPETGARDFWE
jgi:UDP-N-acetylmuramyl tripeptide synthase